MTNPTVAVTAATSMASTTCRQGRWMYLWREQRNEGGTQGCGQDQPQPGWACHIRHVTVWLPLLPAQTLPGCPAA